MINKMEIRELYKHYTLWIILEDPQDKLTIILDTESLDKYYCNHKYQINKLLSYNNRSPFVFLRTKGNCSNKIIGKIVEIPSIENTIKDKVNDEFFKSIKIVPKNSSFTLSLIVFSIEGISTIFPII